VTSVLQRLRGRNPWWRDANWHVDDRQLARLAQAPFKYDARPLDAVQPGTVYTLLGPRRVGKSTAVKQKILELLAGGYPPKRVVYYSCDLLETPDELAGLIEAVYDEARPGGLLEGPAVPFHIFLDEVPTVRNWQLAIKDLHDTTRLDRDCVVLTGSFARDLRSGGELLPGRRGRAMDRDRVMLPMSFRAFVSIVAPDLLLPAGGFSPGDFVTALDPKSPLHDELTRPRTLASLSALQEWLETYALVGGFPLAVADYLSSDERDILAPTFVEMWDVVRGDLNRYHDIRDPRLPLKILERLSLNVASPVSWNRLAQEASTTVPTVQKYVELFRDAYLFLVLQRWDKGVPALKAEKKVYPMDPLIGRLAAAIHSRGRFLPDVTRQVEALLAVAFFRHQVTRDPMAAFGVDALSYYRTTRNKEIDFLVGNDQEPFELKYSVSPTRSDAKVMQASFGKGVLVTQSTLDLEGQVAFVPAALLLAMLG
jgi:uncharacterized protein